MATYAGRYDEALIRRLGNRPAFPPSGTTVLVYQSDGSTTATLYTDRTKATTAANPVAVDASGNLEFFAEPGTYVLSIRESGSQVATNTVTVLNDPAESTGGGATNLTWTASTSTVASDTGTDAVLTAVDATNPGLMTVAQSNKLAGIEAGAQVNTVTSVAAKTGAVSLVKGDVGLGNVDNTSDAAKPVSTAQQAALDAKVDKAQTVNAQTGTAYTLVAADAGKLVTLSNAGAITLTVPQDTDATIAVGTYVDLMQLGAGQVTVVAGTGATLRVSGLTAKARAQYARLGVQKVSASTWSLFGDLASS